MYPVFLDAGYPIELFWDSSIEEITDLLESANRRQEARLKEQLGLVSFLSSQIQERIGTMFDKSVKVTQLWDVFPELFKEEKEIVDKREKEKQLKLYLAKFQHFANNHNTKMK